MVASLFNLFPTIVRYLLGFVGKRPNFSDNVQEKRCASFFLDELHSPGSAAEDPFLPLLSAKWKELVSVICCTFLLSTIIRHIEQEAHEF